MFDHNSSLSPIRLLVLAVTGLMLLASSATAASFGGLVLDRTDTRPLLGATVTLRPSDPTAQLRGTATDEMGRFEITDIAPGEYTVEISFVGFSAEKMTITVTEDVPVPGVTFSLTPKAIDLNTISVTASRRPEKLNDAPAAVSLIEAEQIEDRTVLTLTEHLKGLAAVDVASTGLNQSNVVTRGFNNIFSGSLLVLTDNRIARVPSLRFNAYNFISTVGSDIEQIEVVAGPGSALYGPNAASGVMHTVTKSPFGSEGTTVSVGGGEREVAVGSFRHAGSFNGRVGYKLTGQYYQGEDWKHYEPSEPATIRKFRPTPEGPVYVGGEVDNQRDFSIKKMSGEARVDFLLDENTSLIVNGGYNLGSSIELTGLGAGQAIDWGYSNFQSRFRYKDLFIQGYVNASDAGETYLLESGQLIVDKSKLWVAQIQHSARPGDRLFLTYGADGIFTRPNTEGTINGRNEDKDNIDEIGVYFQAEAQMNERFKFVGAARFDDHNRLDGVVFSPRAGLVYQPDDRNNFRLTYNRAYQTPDNNNLYLDIAQNIDPFGIGAAFAPSLGFNPGIDIRVYGVPETGYHWRMGAGGPYFRSSFAPAAGMTTNDYIPYNDPMFTNVMWNVGRSAVLGGLSSRLNAAVAGGLIDATTAGAIMSSVNSVAPATVSGVDNRMMTFDPDTRSFQPSSISDIADIDRLEPSITQTFELGYKGVINERLRFSLDAYRTEKDNFIGPLTVESPNVFLDGSSLAGYLGGQFGTAYAAADPTTKAYLDQLDNPAFGGNGDGNPVPELTTMFTTGAAGIPYGTVTPEEALDPTALMVTYRNFGDIVYYGIDLSFDYHLSHYWNVGGSYSYISKNFFAKDENQVHDINLNSPRNKAGLFAQYTSPKHQLSAGVRVRYVDAFNMDSPFLGSRVDSYILTDLNGGINFMANTRLTMTIQNLFDNRHIEFVGAPEIGRLAVARVTQSF